jgi:large subunit ribosomal protein L1
LVGEHKQLEPILIVLYMMDAKTAIAELRKEKSRKFTQSVDLIVNLKNFDVRREALNTFIFIPNGSPKKLAAFTTRRSKIIDTITEEDFVKYKDLKDIKKLANSYDAFISAAPMMAKVATKFGRVFGPENKMPSPLAGIVPQDTDEALTAMIKKMEGAIRIKNKEMSIKISVGKENMTDDQLAENITTAIEGLKKKLPRGNDNVKEVLVKFTMTKPITIIEK